MGHTVKVRLALGLIVILLVSGVLGWSTLDTLNLYYSSCAAGELSCKTP